MLSPSPLFIVCACHHIHRQFKRAEERARSEGSYSPPGLVSVDQFRSVWRKFSVRVSEDQAYALFIKFGHDSQVRCLGGRGC